MNLFKKTSLLMLSVVGLGLSSCDMEQVEPLSASSTKEFKYGESNFANIYTDRETTDLVWNLRSVTVDGVDYTAQYVRKERSGYTDSYLDIRRDGTFIGILLTHNNTGVGTGAGSDTETPLEWKLMGNKIDLFERYGLENLTETELSLSLTKENSPVTFDGEVMTFNFVKEEKLEIDLSLLVSYYDWSVRSYVLNGEETVYSDQYRGPLPYFNFYEDNSVGGLFMGVMLWNHRATWKLDGYELTIDSGYDTQPILYCKILVLKENELRMDIRRGDTGIVYHDVYLRHHN